MSSEIKEGIIDEIKQGTSISKIKTRIRRIHNTGHTVKVPPKIDDKGKIVRRGYQYKIPPDRYAEIIARSESIRWAGEGRIRSYERSGVVSGVRLETAGDKRVCPICSAMHGTEYTLEDSHTVLPVHCLCRCTMVPLLFMNGKEQVPGAKGVSVGDLIVTATAIKLAIPNEIKEEARQNIADYNQEQRESE
jgi:SPP1 gp7 family putative phage head morphogenesis protein